MVETDFEEIRTTWQTVRDLRDSAETDWEICPHGNAERKDHLAAATSTLRAAMDALEEAEHHIFMAGQVTG